MNLKLKKSTTIKWSAIVIVVLILEAMDFSYNNIKTVIDGSYRADSLFTAKPSPSTTVAVIASDNKLLKNPVAVTSSALTFAQIKDMVKNAIDMVGGISNYVQLGDTVLIKPNIVGAKLTGDGENTDIRVVKAIISIIYDAYGNGCKLYIGEGSARSNAQMGGPGWIIAGYTALASDVEMTGIKFELVDLNDEVDGGVNLVNVPTKASLAEPLGGKYWIHKFLISPNIKYIDVPVMKMHEPGLTCVLKNQIGIAAGAKYGWNKTKGGTGGALIHHAQFLATYNYKSWQDEEIVDLTSCLNNITLSVVDALMTLESQKTLILGNTNQVRLNTIIAGADPVAVDHVCAKIMGANPDDIAHITMAEKIGLGTNNTDSISIVGENIATKYSYRFKRASIHSMYGQGNRVWLVSPSYTYTTMAINYIANEAAINPSKGETPWSAPIYFFDDRIDLNSFKSPVGNVVTYCFTNVYSPEAKSNVELWLNSEEDMMVYLNGAKVYTYSGSRPNANIVTDKPLINLLKGENRILVKVLQKTACYDFSLNICEPNTDGNRVDGLKFYIKNYNEPNALISGISPKQNPAYPELKLIQTTDKLQVTGIDVERITIYDLKGKIISTSNESSINLGNMIRGTYIASLKLNDGKVVSKKFIKQ